MKRIELEKKVKEQEKELDALKKLLLNKGWRHEEFSGVEPLDWSYLRGWDKKVHQREVTRRYDLEFGVEQRTWQHTPIANFSAMLGALGMSRREFGLCYGMSRQGVEGMLERELRYAIRLDTMWRMAESIDCELVVRVRPKNGLSLREFRMLEAYKLKRAMGREEHVAKVYGEAVGNGAKMDWSNWARLRRKGKM